MGLSDCIVCPAPYRILQWHPYIPTVYSAVFPICFPALIVCIADPVTWIVNHKDAVNRVELTIRYYSGATVEAAETPCIHVSQLVRSWLACHLTDAAHRWRRHCWPEDNMRETLSQNVRWSPYRKKLLNIKWTLAAEVYLTFNNIFQRVIVQK